MRRTMLFFLIIMIGSLTACQQLEVGLPGDRMLMGPMVAFLPEPHGAPEALYIFNKHSQEQQDHHYLSKFDPQQNSLVWEFEVPSAVALSSYEIHLKVHHDVIALKTEALLIVLDAQTGESLWKTQLTGEVCESCLVLTDDRVFVLDSTGQISAWDAENGKVLWRLALNKNDSPDFSLDVVLDMLVVLDEASSEGTAQGVLLVIRQDTGEVVAQLTSACPDAEGFFDDTPFRYSDSYQVQRGGTVILLMENIRQVCVSFQSILEGREVYRSFLPEDFSLPFFEPASTILATDSGLFIGSEANGESCSLLQIDSGGQVKSVVEEPACIVLDPVFWSQPVLYYTTLSEEVDARMLHAYDVESNRALWTVPLDVSESLLDEEKIAFWQHNGKLEFYYTFEEDSINQLAYQVMDPVSGDVNVDLVITPFGQDPWEIYPIQDPDGFYYLSENSLMFYDVRLRQEQVIWPAFYLSD